jgi:hypothetical protein
MKKISILLLISFVSIAIILMYAFKSIDDKDLYGTYIAKYSFGTEKLILKEDRKYIQEVFITDETDGKPRSLTCKGHWKYDPSDRYVLLENALAVADPAGGFRKKYDVLFDGIVLRKVRRVLPSIRLGTAYEDIDFEKLK